MATLQALKRCHPTDVHSSVCLVSACWRECDESGRCQRGNRASSQPSHRERLLSRILCSLPMNKQVAQTGRTSRPCSDHPMQEECIRILKTWKHGFFYIVLGWQQLDVSYIGCSMKQMILSWKQMDASRTACSGNVTLLSWQ